MSASRGEARPRRPWLLPLVAVALLCLVGFGALDRYGVTWDEALGDFFFGQRYLSYFTSFDPIYLDFAADPYPTDRLPDLRASPFRNRPWEYYPVANTLAAATSRYASSSDWPGATTVSSVSTVAE